MNRILTTGVVAVTHLALVGVAVAPQLSARLVGESYVMRVAPLDPIDPFRGAYVALDYPDLRHDRPDDQGTTIGATGGLGVIDDGDQGAVYVTLVQEGDVWVAGQWQRGRPESGPYLACDDRSWRIRCGIDSWFLPPDRAAEAERLLGDGAYAEVRVDSRGHAAVVDLRDVP